MFKTNNAAVAPYGEWQQSGLPREGPQPTDFPELTGHNCTKLAHVAPAKVKGYYRREGTPEAGNRKGEMGGGATKPRGTKSLHSPVQALHLAGQDARCWGHPRPPDSSSLPSAMLARTDPDTTTKTSLHLAARQSRHLPRWNRKPSQLCR